MLKVWRYFKSDKSEENKRQQKQKVNTSLPKDNSVIVNDNYSIHNFQLIHSIGKSFYEDYESKGIKLFAIASLGYYTSQQHGILGLASYFDFKKELQIAIVSSNLYEGVFGNITSSSDKVVKELGNSKYQCEIMRFDTHFDFIDMNNIIEFAATNPREYEDYLNELCNSWDVIFFDVPELAQLRNNIQLFHGLITKFQSLSVIVAKHVSHSKELEDINEFFASYGISLKGLFFEPSDRKKDEKT